MVTQAQLLNQQDALAGQVRRQQEEAIRQEQQRQAEEILRQQEVSRVEEVRKAQEVQPQGLSDTQREQIANYLRKTVNQTPGFLSAKQERRVVSELSKFGISEADARAMYKYGVTSSGSYQGEFEYKQAQAQPKAYSPGPMEQATAEGLARAQTGEAPKPLVTSMPSTDVSKFQKIVTSAQINPLITKSEYTPTSPTVVEMAKNVYSSKPIIHPRPSTDTTQLTFSLPYQVRATGTVIGGVMTAPTITVDTSKQNIPSFTSFVLKTGDVAAASVESVLPPFWTITGKSAKELGSADPTILGVLKKYPVGFAESVKAKMFGSETETTTFLEQVGKSDISPFWKGAATYATYSPYVLPGTSQILGGTMAYTGGRTLTNKDSTIGERLGGAAQVAGGAFPLRGIIPSVNVPKTGVVGKITDWFKVKGTKAEMALYQKAKTAALFSVLGSVAGVIGRSEYQRTGSPTVGLVTASTLYTGGIPSTNKFFPPKKSVYEKANEILTEQARASAKAKTDYLKTRAKLEEVDALAGKGFGSEISDISKSSDRLIITRGSEGKTAEIQNYFKGAKGPVIIDENVPTEKISSGVPDKTSKVKEYMEAKVLSRKDYKIEPSSYIELTADAASVTRTKTPMPELTPDVRAIFQSKPTQQISVGQITQVGQNARGFIVTGTPKSRVLKAESPEIGLKDAYSKLGDKTTIFVKANKRFAQFDIFESAAKSTKKVGPFKVEQFPRARKVGQQFAKIKSTQRKFLAEEVVLADGRVLPAGSELGIAKVSIIKSPLASKRVSPLEFNKDVARVQLRKPRGTKIAEEDIAYVRVPTGEILTELKVSKGTYGLDITGKVGKGFREIGKGVSKSTESAEGLFLGIPESKFISGGVKGEGVLKSLYGGPTVQEILPKIIPQVTPRVSVALPKITKPSVGAKTSPTIRIVPSSAYAGLGLYERTEGVSAFDIRPNVNIGITGRTIGGVIQNRKEIEVLKPKLDLGVVDIGKNIYRDRIMPVEIVSPRLMPKTIQSPRETFVPKETQRQVPILRTPQITRPKQPERNLPRFQPPRMPRPGTPKPPRPGEPGIPVFPLIARPKGLKLKSKTRADEIKGYVVSVRRKGKFQPIDIVSTATQAEALGIKQVTKEAAASFKITPTTKIGRSINIQTTAYERALFAPAKREVGVTVQKRPLRIITPGEKAAISYKGALATSKSPFKRIKFGFKSLF